MMKKYVKPGIEIEAFLTSQIMNRSGRPDETDGGNEGYKPGEGDDIGGEINSNKKGFGSNSIWD